MPDERHLAEAFVELADTLVADFDVVDFLHMLAERCVQLLDVQAAALLLADQRGQLLLMASSSEQARLLELFQLDTDEGPCVACYRSGRPMVDTELSRPDPRWPSFGQQAMAAGFSAVHALPMRLRDEIIGVVNLFSSVPRPLAQDDIRIGQALADVATIGLLQQRAIQHRQVLAEQLQGALDSRVLIEQAKGVLAERLQVDMQYAFEALRAYARRNSRRLTDLAQSVIDNLVDTADLIASFEPPPGQRATGRVTPQAD
jgi:transcriptional regulator with GAF, ATPase, and Fis domain